MYYDFVSFSNSNFDMVPDRLNHEPADLQALQRETCHGIKSLRRRCLLVHVPR